MKTRITLVTVIVLQVSIALAQDPTPMPNQNVEPWGLQIRGVQGAPEPLFIVNSDNRTLVIMPSSTSGLKFNNSLPSDLQAISPNLINSIRVYKTEEAVDLFGQPAKNGVVVIDLKDGSIEKLPTHLADRFSVKK